MSRPRYTDPWDDPNADPEDIKYGDYDPDGGLTGYTITSIFDDQEEDDDSDA